MPITINPSRFKTPPFAHQLTGIRKLVDNEAFALFDEMGAGKSKQVIDAACVLAEDGNLDTVIIVTPASARTVWCEETIGEIRKHAWVPSRVTEFALGKITQRWSDDAPSIQWCVTNYEILRNTKHLNFLIGQLRWGGIDKYGAKTLLVFDESSYVKNRTAKQTKACKELRSHATRCIILNGTPIYNNPGDLWSQMQVLKPKNAERKDRVQCSVFTDNWWRFRARYAVMGGFKAKQIVKWQHLDDISKSVAPYVLRRLKADCLDLPAKLYERREVALTPESWVRYQSMKRDAVLALSDEDVRVEPNAAVKIMRLAQLTSGILGGITLGDGMKYADDPFNGDPMITDLSSEKLDWCMDYLVNECTAKYVLIWCRWRRERERLVERLRTHILSGKNGLNGVCEIYGGQPRDRRDVAVETFSKPMPESFGDFKIACVAQPHAGGLGLNLIAATEVIYLSNDFSYGLRLQSEDRCHRPGQKHPVTYIDVLATGPKGQKTIDHTVAAALAAKENLAALTMAQWRKRLEP